MRSVRKTARFTIRKPSLSPRRERQHSLSTARRPSAQDNLISAQSPSIRTIRRRLSLRPLGRLGIGHTRNSQVEDLLTGRLLWTGARNFVSLNPTHPPQRTFSECVSGRDVRTGRTSTSYLLPRRIDAATPKQRGLARNSLRPVASISLPFCGRAEGFHGSGETLKASLLPVIAAATRHLMQIEAVEGLGREQTQAAKSP